MSLKLYNDFFKGIHFDIDCLKDYEKIYVLVSGGYDSTLLADWIYSWYPQKTLFINCYNPYETSATLDDFKKYPLLVIKPDEKYEYGKILEDAFLKLNQAADDRAAGNYQKKVFSCCYFIKHKAFLNDDLFTAPNTVVISGIKSGDGTQRRLFLSALRKGSGSQKSITESSFFLVHKKGQNYCYPYRDYHKKELPREIKRTLKEHHKDLRHSGCSICPVLVLFSDRIKGDSVRKLRSIDYLKQLIAKGKFTPSKTLLQYVDLNQSRLLLTKIGGARDAGNRRE